MKQQQRRPLISTTTALFRFALQKWKRYLDKNSNGTVFFEGWDIVWRRLNSSPSKAFRQLTRSRSDPPPPPPPPPTSERAPRPRSVYQAVPPVPSPVSGWWTKVHLCNEQKNMGGTHMAGSRLRFLLTAKLLTAGSGCLYLVRRSFALSRYFSWKRAERGHWEWRVVRSTSPGKGGWVSHVKWLGMLVGNFCFDPYEVLQRAWFKLFSTPKRNQKRQHTESGTHVL